jgi:hypothetical protein
MLRVVLPSKLLRKFGAVTAIGFHPPSARVTTAARRALDNFVVVVVARKVAAWEIVRVALACVVNIVMCVRACGVRVCG